MHVAPSLVTDKYADRQIHTHTHTHTHKPTTVTLAHAAHAPRVNKYIIVYQNVLVWRPLSVAGVYILCQS